MLRARVLRMIELAWAPLRAELRRFVARHVPAADADDVVQEAMLRIHRGLAGVRADGALVGWMYQVTRHALVNHVRAARPTAELPAELGAEVEPEDVPFRALVACVATFVAKLPAPYREAIELVELGGVSQVEAARRLGVPLSTMKARVQRGRDRLRRALEACCAIDLDVRGHVTGVVPRRDASCGCRPA